MKGQSSIGVKTGCKNLLMRTASKSASSLCLLFIITLEHLKTLCGIDCEQPGSRSTKRKVKLVQSLERKARGRLPGFCLLPTTIACCEKPWELRAHTAGLGRAPQSCIPGAESQQAVEPPCSCGCGESTMGAPRFGRSHRALRPYPRDGLLHPSKTIQETGEGR